MALSAFDLCVKGILNSAQAPAPAAGITFVGSDRGVGDAGINIPLTLPAHAADDFGIVFAGGDGGVTGFSITAASGWTELFDAQEVTGRNRRSAVFYKKLTSGSETDPVLTSANNDQISASVHVFRGVDTVTPFDVSEAADHGQNSFNFNTPAITTVSDNCAILALGAQTHNNVTAWGAPTGYTLGENIAAADLSRNHYNQAVAYLLDAGSAGANGNISWNNTGAGGLADWTAVTLALRPA